MKGSQAIAQKYARALFQAITESSKVELYISVLDKLNMFMNQKEIFKDFMMNPAIPIKVKIEFLNSTFELDEILRNFFSLLLEKKRFHMLELIYNSFKNIAYQENGIIQVRCISAKRLSQDEIERTKEVLKKKFGKKVELQINEDKSLLAGIVIFFDSQMVDLTVKGELERMLSQTLEGVRS